jgi:hypothetical protein
VQALSVDTLVAQHAAQLAHRFAAVALISGRPAAYLAEHAAAGEALRNALLAGRHLP